MQKEIRLGCNINAALARLSKSDGFVSVRFFIRTTLAFPIHGGSIPPPFLSPILPSFAPLNPSFRYIPHSILHLLLRHEINLPENFPAPLRITIWPASERRNPDIFFIISRLDAIFSKGSKRTAQWGKI